MDALAHLKTSLAPRYLLEREIGRGGMATVYLARDVRHDRNVAVKVLNPELGAVVGVERFLSEIKVTANLQHPNLLPLFDSGEVDGQLFYVMPYVAGESLRDRLHREKQLPIDEALQLAITIAGALDYAHRQGVVHRDLKPENILLANGQAIVADFGIALAVSAAGGERITQTGISVGTPQYMSPEQATGDRVIDQRSDVYSLGAVLYECLTGDPPHTASTAQAVIAKVCADAPASVRTTRPGVPANVEAAILRSLEKVPADRWNSALEFANALQGAGARKATPTRVLPWVAALVIAAGVGVTLYATRDQGASTVSQAGDTNSTTRLAVLPMANLGADTSDAYFAAGMTDELISTLSDIAGVQVIARSAVIPYAGSTKPLADIARELGVGTILESTCRKERNRLRISVRLVDARTQAPRWSEQYDRELTDAFSIQRDVARSVAEALQIRLSGRESRALSGGGLPTTSAEAYEAYLHGRIDMTEPVTRPRNEQAIAWLQKAIALDSNFAVAHAMLGKAYVMRLFRLEPGDRYRNLAAAAIARALALDSTLAEAYVARADLAYTPEAGWAYDDALRDLLRALSLKPGLAAAHASLGSLLFHIGMPREAEERLRHSLSLDPTNRFAGWRVGRALWYAQQFDSALVVFERAPQVTEHALVLGYLGREREGLAQLARAESTREGEESGDFAAVRAVLHSRLGDRAQALREIAAVERSRGAGFAHFHHAQFNVATALALLGQSEEAVRWLEQAAANGMPAYELFANDPHLKSLRGHPGYETLLQRERTNYERRKAIYAQWSMAR